MLCCRGVIAVGDAWVVVGAIDVGGRVRMLNRSSCSLGGDIMEARDRCSSSVDVKMQLADILDEYCTPVTEVWVPHDSTSSLSSASSFVPIPLLFAFLDDAYGAEL